MAEVEARRKMIEAAVMFEGDTQDVLRATGNDRASFLHRITSGKVDGIEVGQGGRTLLLDVRGRVLSSLVVFARAKSVRVLVAGGQAAEVVAGLSRYAIMDDFRIVAEAELGSLLVLGPRAALALEGVGVPDAAEVLAAPRLAHADVASEPFGPVWIAHVRTSGAAGLRVIADRAACAAIAAALLASGVPRLAPEVAEAMRIAALEPAPGKEIVPERFPVEVGLGAAIDHTKGCYVGQETIVRMRDRGIIRKRLALLRLAGTETPSPGDKVTSDGQPAAGQITSAAGLPDEPSLALAVLSSAIAVGATVQIQRADAPLSAEVVADSPPWG